MRPVIGVGTTFEMDSEGGISAAKPRYWQAIVEAGGLPFLLPQLEGSEIIEGALRHVDGFLMIGGYDVRGEAFGQRSLSTVVRIEESRERTDFALLRALIESRKPTLALCLGFQELNVVQGGTLYQDILFDGPETSVPHYAQGGVIPKHAVEVTPNSRLARILGRDGRIDVNSTHHQAVAEVGAGLQVSARSEDGIVEAIEMPEHPFMIGVQWHPELMSDSREQQRLFAALVDEAKRHAAEAARV